MKNIKIIVATVFVLLVTININGQDSSLNQQVVVPLSDPGKPGKLKIGLISGSIKVTGYSGKEVVINTRAKEQKVSKSKKNGLTKISSTSIDLSAEEQSNYVRVSSNSYNRTINLEIQVPQNFSLKLSTINNGDIEVENVNGEIEANNTNGGISLINIGGSVLANTTNGEVKVVFSKVEANASMAFSTFNDNVDVTFPSNVKADIKAKTERGDVYTDFDMKIDKREPDVQRDSRSGSYKVKIEQWVYGKINGGGPEMMFKTFNGDIIIRSK